MSQPRLPLGATVDLTLTLKTQAGSAVDVSSADTIVVKIGPADRSETTAGPYPAEAGTTGASWSTGVVVVSVPAADTRNDAPGSLIAQVEVTGGAAPGVYESEVPMLGIRVLP